jgi:hypothetical protein
LTEAEVVENIAARVIAGLQTHGIAADLLDEFDARLQGYVATGLVSIHADSCDYINVATASDHRLRLYGLIGAIDLCRGAYRQATQMSYHAATITPHDRLPRLPRIAAGVPGILLEVGFLNLDRASLTTQPDVVAGAITDGILCYVDDIRGGVNYASTAGPPAPSEP